MHFMYTKGVVEFKNKHLGRVARQLTCLGAMAQLNAKRAGKIEEN